MLSGWCLKEVETPASSSMETPGDVGVSSWYSY